MKKTCVIFVIALCFLLVAAVQMPYKTTVSAEPFSSFESGNKNYPEGLNDAISTHLFDTESSYPTFVNSVYIVREEYLIKKDKTTYFIPYIMADVRDVWTAGMSTWGFWLNTLVVEEDGTTTINANKNNNRSETIFTVEADPNTFIRDAYSGGFFEDCIMSITLGKIEWVAMKEPFFSFDAVTLDSSKPRNTDSVVSFKWESAFTVGIGKKIPFVVEGGAAYINNYKYENSDEWFSDLFDESARSEDEKHYREELRNSVSFEGTMLFYEDGFYDVTLQNRAINSISSAIPAGEKLVVECHVGPQNSVYCIFDTVSRSFDGHITGNNLVWYDDNVETAVYAFGTEIYTYDGRLIKSYEFEEKEYIYQMEFSDDHTKLNIEIMYIDGATQIDIIDL